MLRRSVPSVLALLLCASCIPDLGPWRVLRPGQDGGPRLDAGRDQLDGGGGPFMPCAQVQPLTGLYEEGFEAGPGGWRVVGEFSSWELGTPSSENINRAAFGNNAWVTNLDGEYPDNEETYVYSPCFDASSSQADLTIDLWRTYQTESTHDYGRLEVSTDSGLNWETVTGSSSEGFYSSEPGWNGRFGTGNWRRASAIVVGTAGQPRVLFRLLWHADERTTDDGFGFDEVRIQPSQVDLGVRVEQGDECGMAVVTVFNAGGVPIPDGFELTTVVDGVSEITTYDQEVDFRDEVSYEIGEDLARSLSASVFVIGDQNAANDQASYAVTTVPASSFFRDFEADDGGLTVSGNNPSWEWGVPAGTLISVAANGERAWVTNLSGDHNSNEQSFLYTPCIDMRGLSRDPQVTLSQVYRSEMGRDYLRIETSVDGGSFRTVGSSSSEGTNWYDDFNGWTGASGGGAWRTAQHALTGTMGAEFVRIRFRMNSDGSVENEGFGIDNLQVLP